MDIQTKRLDNANCEILAHISKQELETKEKALAKKIAKDMKVDGFRKGKVPGHVVIARFGAQIKQDAQNELINEIYKNAVKDFGEKTQILGNPFFDKFNEKDGNIEFTMKISIRPEMNLDGHKDLIPDFEKPTVEEKEIDEAINTVAQASSVKQDVSEDRELKEGDVAIIDFEGFIDGEKLDGGTAKDFSLEIGSKSFIEGFEEGLIGSKKGDEKTLSLKFPDDYSAKHLAGKDTEFRVVIKNIQEKVLPEINDEFAKKMLPNEKEATLEKLQNVVKESLESEKLSRLYNEELKGNLMDLLVKKYDFDLPQTVVDEEIDNLINSKLSKMEEKERNEIIKNQEKLDEIKKEVEEDAKERVKATLIVDELAKKENIVVTDQEVATTIYYEAMQSGQDPKAVIEYYEKQGLLPVVKMAMLEDKVLNKLLDTKLEKDKKEEA
jgi:trigger factor